MGNFDGTRTWFPNATEDEVRKSAEDEAEYSKNWSAQKIKSVAARLARIVTRNRKVE